MARQRKANVSVRYELYVAYVRYELYATYVHLTLPYHKRNNYCNLYLRPDDFPKNYVKVGLLFCPHEISF